MLLMAVALLVLGIVFFVQKTADPKVPVILVLVAIALGVGAFVFD